jgi:hypothetical protein
MMEFASSVSDRKCVQTRVNVVINININSMRNRVGSEEGVNVVINLYSQNFVRKSCKFCVDNHITFVQLVKVFDYNVINLSEIMASADIRFQIIGAVYNQHV